MRLQKISLTCITIITVALCTPVAVNFSVVQVLAQTTAFPKAEADRLLQQGLSEFHTSQFEVALQSFQQALTLYRDIKDRQGEGNALFRLGTIYLILGDRVHAIEYLQQSLAIARETQNQQLEKKNQAWLSIVQGQTQSHSQRVEASWFSNVGTYQYAIGQVQQALQSWQQELAIYRELKDRQSEGRVLNNLGDAYETVGNYALAIEYYQQALTLARSLHDRTGEGKALDNLGDAYWVLGNYTKAIEYSQQSLTIARSLHDREREGDALTSLGLAYQDRGDYTKAIGYHQQALTIARSLHDREREGDTLNNLGLALLKAHNLSEAERTLHAAIQVYEHLRTDSTDDEVKVIIFEGEARSCRLLQQVLIAQKRPQEALEIAERGRARAFVELLASYLSSNPSASVQITPPSLQQLQQVARQQNATLVEYSIIYHHATLVRPLFFYDFKIPGKQQFHEEQLYIWVIKPTGEVTFRTSDLKQLWQKQHTTLADLVTTSRDSIGVRGRGLNIVATQPSAEQTNHLQQLHQLLIQPIADLLPTNPNARIVFVPQESLFLVPFAALQDASGKYLIEKHTILSAPSIQVLQLTHQQRARVPGKAKDVLVVGNPTMPLVQPLGQPQQQLPQLPGAEQEAKAIAQLLHTQALIGNQATKAAILSELPKAKLIHLATHGLLDDFRKRIPGAIALGPSQIGKLNDGLLTADEIIQMKLNAELVVLSACNTGQGKITGDGVVGLSRSLMTAGVPSIIVSLWSVPDAPTASLMKQFYTNLQSYPDKAQALRQAMLSTMKQHKQPKDWAAFTLIGQAQ